MATETMSKTATNMITGLRRAVTRGALKLETKTDKPKASDTAEKPKSEESKEKREIAPPAVPEPPQEPPRPRTREDDELHVHTAKLKEPPAPLRRSNSRRSSTKSIPKAHKIYYAEPEPTFYKEEAAMNNQREIPPVPPSPTSSSPPPKSPLLAIIDEILESLNLQGVASVVKNMSGRISEMIVRSEYVSTEWNGQLHLHSFGFGVGFFLLMMFLYPYVEKYLSTWLDVFGSLFKHGSMLVIGYLIFTLINKPAKKPESQTKKIEHNYTELQYSVKSSEPTRSPSPSKKGRRSLPRRDTEPSLASRRPSSFSPTDAHMLINMTEQQQFMERARLDSGPRDPYDKFMSGAIREEGKREKYNNFIDDATKKDEERQKYKKFIGATRDQIMRQRD